VKVDWTLSTVDCQTVTARARRCLVGVFVSLLAGAPVANAQSLLEAYELARDGDPRYLSAQLERDAAAAGVPVAKSALRPRLALVTDIAYVYDSLEGSDNEESSISPSIQLRYPVYDKTARLAVDSARVLANEAESSFDAAEQELFLRTASLYFNVLRADDALDFASAAESALVEQVSFAEATLARGLGTRPDLLVAMSRLESARADKTAATTAQFAAKEILAVAIGRAPGRLARLDETLELSSPSPNDIEFWVDQAVQNNPSVREVQLRSERALVGIQRARAGRTPVVDFLTDFTFSRSDRESLDEGEFGEVVLRLTVPLYSGGEFKARARQARVLSDVAATEFEFASKTLVQRVRVAFAEVRSAIARARSLEQSVASAEAGLAAIEEAVQAQARSIVDLLDATTELADVRTQLSGARYDYLLSLLTLQSLSSGVTRESIGVIDAIMVQGS